MNEGDVFLATLPHADGTIKNRPAIVLRKMPPFGDYLVCGVSSQTRQAVPDFDELIKPGDADFVTSGSKAPSIIRLGFLAVLPSGRFGGTIGDIAPECHRRLLNRLSDHLRS